MNNPILTLLSFLVLFFIQSTQHFLNFGEIHCGLLPDKNPGYATGPIFVQWIPVQTHTINFLIHLVSNGQLAF